MDSALLSISDLRVSFSGSGDGQAAQALRGVDLDVGAGEVHGLVGESGCGKTVTSTCVMGLLPVPPASIDSGTVIFEGRDLLRLNPEERRRVRGRKIAMVFQEPSRYLNPSFRIGEQIGEMLRYHRGMDGRQAAGRAGGLIDLVGLGSARRVLSAYPHELSGGEKQRAMIAMAISCEPSLFIADEPTTALDVTLQVQILALLLKLRAALHMAVLFVSHDLRLVRAIADRVTVMYAGKVVESGPAGALYDSPLHPYTRLLLQSIPSAQRRGTPLRVIPGRVPDARDIPTGCAFHPRCPLAAARCREEDPARTTAPHSAACHFAGMPWQD